MYTLDTLVVGLDLTEMDETLISYTSSLAGVIGAKRIYFLNVQRDLDISEGVKQALEIGDTPYDEYCEQVMRSKVEEFFPNASDYEVQYEVAEGNPATEVLKWTNIKEADVLIMGRKRNLKGAGVMPNQVTSKVRCSVLFVPEGYKTVKMDQIVVPVDMSPDAKMALEEAVTLRKENGTTKITAINAFELPTGYYYTGKSDQEFADVLEKNFREELSEFLSSELGSDAEGIAQEVVWCEDNGIADTLNNRAHELSADMIIMGAKGRSLASGLFLGSVAGKLVMRDSDIPLLVVKDKERSFNFWEMIKSL